MKQNPCYGCEDRKLYCHSDCQKYIKWQKYNDKVKHNRRMSKEQSYYASEEKLKNKLERERY